MSQQEQWFCLRGHIGGLLDFAVCRNCPWHGGTGFVVGKQSLTKLDACSASIGDVYRLQHAFCCTQQCRCRYCAAWHMPCYDTPEVLSHLHRWPNQNSQRGVLAKYALYSDPKLRERNASSPGITTADNHTNMGAIMHMIHAESKRSASRGICTKMRSE
jgi:hypothetical protein